MKFNIVTFGCKVNQYESNMMKERMLSSNFFHTEELKNANIIIVNTCSVTNVADKKCLKMIRRIKREYPNAILVVAGCSSQNKQEEYENLGINIKFITIFIIADTMVVVPIIFVSLYAPNIPPKKFDMFV